MADPEITRAAAGDDTFDFADPQPAFLTQLDEDPDAACHDLALFVNRLLTDRPPAILLRLDPEVRHDMIQDTLIRLIGPEQREKGFPRLRRYEPRGWPFACWVRTVAKNVVRSYFGRKEDPTDPTVLPEPDEDATDPEPRTNREERSIRHKRQAFLSCFAKLSDFCRLVLTLRYVDRMSYNDIGPIMNLSNKDASDRARRCRATLGKCMAKGGLRRFDPGVV